MRTDVGMNSGFLLVQFASGINLQKLLQNIERYSEKQVQQTVVYRDNPDTEKQGPMDPMLMMQQQQQLQQEQQVSARLLQLRITHRTGVDPMHPCARSRQ
jgi:hypothetical protein